MMIKILTILVPFSFGTRLVLTWLVKVFFIRSVFVLSSERENC